MASKSFSLHSELLEELRVKKSCRTEHSANCGTIAVIEGDLLCTTAMLISELQLLMINPCTFVKTAEHPLMESP